jgi:transposase
VPHNDPADPPRRRANKAAGHGTWDTDRPPVCGVVGRECGRLALRVGRRNWAAELVHQTVVPRTRPGATAYTDEWSGYKPLRAAGRGHAAVRHNAGEWARDDDGDGVREVHGNTPEGLWTGLRNFLRPFRGVSKKYLRAIHKNVRVVIQYQAGHRRLPPSPARGPGRGTPPEADHQIGPMSHDGFGKLG